MHAENYAPISTAILSWNTGTSDGSGLYLGCYSLNKVVVVVGN